MSNSTAKRVVDTIKVEIDVELAEKLMKVLGLVSDLTDGYQELRHLAEVLEFEGEVRSSPLYTASVSDGRVIVDWDRSRT